MPSTYTPSGVELIGDGEQSGTWGSKTNTNLQILDRLTSQAGTISLSGTSHTLTISDGVLSDGQYGVLVFGGAPSGTNTVTISPNDAQRTYIVKNDSGEGVILSQGSGNTVTVADGSGAIVYCDGAGSGAAVVDLTATFATTLAALGVTASASELNILDGATLSTAELNILDGATLSTAELNILDGVTATAAELNILDGVTATTTELNILDGVTATTTELNILDGVTAKTGADSVLVTGTAGTDGQYAQWNADGDVVGADISTLPEATWESGTSTTEAVISPAKLAAAIDAAAGAAWTESAVVNTTSGTAVDLSSLPSTVTEVEIRLFAVRFSGSGTLFVRAGTTTPDSSGYASVNNAVGTTTMASESASFTRIAVRGANDVFVGTIRLYRTPSTNFWMCHTLMPRTSTVGIEFNTFTGGGYKLFSSAVDIIRIYFDSFSNTFNSGALVWRYR